MRYCIIKIDFFDFWVWTYSALSYFIHAEAGILNLFLIKEKEFRVIIKFYFYKEVKPAGNCIVACCNYLQKLEQQNFIQTCIKVLITFHWFSNIQKNEEKNLLFAFEKEFLITYNFD